MVIIKVLEIYGCEQCRFHYDNVEKEHYCLHGRWEDDYDGRLLMGMRGKIYIPFPIWCPLPNALELYETEVMN
jgi:hypothetical protein